MKSYGISEDTKANRKVIVMNSLSPFNPKYVSLHSNARSNSEIIEELAHILYLNGVICDERVFVEDVLFREQISMTGIGNEVAIPHGSTNGVNCTAVAVATLDEAIPWKSIDDLPVRVILLFAEPDEINDDHDKLVYECIRKISSPVSLGFLKSTNDVAEVIDLFD